MPAPSQSTGHILVVDDSGSILRVCEILLRSEGYRVTAAASGVEALAQVAQRHPDLIILDLLMPGMDGWEVLKRLHEQAREVPVVVLTADARGRSRVNAPNVAACISKPFDVDVLLNVVAGVLGARTGESRQPSTDSSSL